MCVCVCLLSLYGWKEGNDALNTFLFTVISEGRKEMFYLTTHSTHFIYGYMERERERNVLFNDALNTFLSTVIWRQTYG